MKNMPLIHCRAALSAVVSLFVILGAAFGGPVMGELVLNPYFEGGDYSHWKFSGAWRPDGKQARLVYDLAPGGRGYPAAVGSVKRLATDAELIRQLRGAGSSLAKARLSALTLNAPYFAVFNADAIGPSSNYEFFVEIDVKTQSGLYRARSRALSDPWHIPTGSLKLLLEWDDSPAYLGDIAEAPLGGIPVLGIEEILYRCVIQVHRSTDPGTGPVFLTIDNCSLQYEITHD